MKLKFSFECPYCNKSINVQIADPIDSEKEDKRGKPTRTTHAKVEIYEYPEPQDFTIHI